ncbi:MAG: hypothetical protein KKB81_06785 [Candidatus Margulisbacteria bacterium]|nr:hypothetical protein [Candidatus Margulisiibacteriota bacterium]MBU1022503.1 hypothetical protein [Candidatus Margulisiibacteriota bacterium]MBU1728487.1 hypothetical protein [Candidatus Margulisiibacteriota bacterium]MBU1954634.1 hypothetical protein [Candidatus Margulisiibacteriota bacterium]
MRAKKLLVILSIALISMFGFQTAAQAGPVTYVGQKAFAKLLTTVVKNKKVKKYLIKKLGIKTPIKWLSKRFNNYLNGCPNPGPWWFLPWWAQGCPVS